MLNKIGEPGSSRATFYELLGGTERVRELVERFYDIMDSDPKAAGSISQRLIANGADALELRADEGEQFTLWLDGECLADSPAYADPEAMDAAMLRLREAIAELAGA